jgi:Flp pilus assembly protein CpaB
VKRSNRLVIFVGVLLAILAFVGIVILLNGNGGGTGGGPQASPSTVTVLVANQDIKIGDPVTPDKVDEKQVDASAANTTRLGSKSQVSGQPSLFAIPKGSQVTLEAIGGGNGPASITAQLKPGEKAIAFQVVRVTGMDFLVRQGDHVDIVISQKITPVQPTVDTINEPAAKQRFETVPGLDQPLSVKTILQNKRVLYVSQSRQAAAAAAASASPAAGGQTQQTPAAIESVIIIFAGTDQDAEAVKFAQSDATTTGVLTAVLRSTQDNIVEKTTGITLQRLVTQYGLVIPNIIKLPVR